jgi:nitronate monooxygenase
MQSDPPLRSALCCRAKHFTGCVGGQALRRKNEAVDFLAAGNARVGCGFITWSLARQPHLLARALDHKPAAIMLSFGDARPFASPIKEAGAALISQVQTVAQAMEAVDLGTDIVVAQGTEAGGHGAARSTLALVPAVVDAVRERNDQVVVVAAGGIADGRGLAAALMLGAQGALLGTRFLASHEALTSAVAKAKLVAARGDDTIRTRVFDIVRNLDWPAPYTGRALQNAFSRQWHGARRNWRKVSPRRRRATRGQPKRTISIPQLSSRVNASISFAT